MRQRGKARSKRSGSSEEAQGKTLGDEGELIWQSRSKQIVTYLRLGLIICVALTLAVACQKGGRSQLIPAAQVVSYPLEKDRFAILVVEDNDVTPAEARQEARQKAAQVTLENGYKYFSILSETEVNVARTSGSDQSRVPGNLYQELIIQKEFGRDSFGKEQRFSTQTLPAIRLVIECYSEKPWMKKSIDAQQFLTHCH